MQDQLANIADGALKLDEAEDDMRVGDDASFVWHIVWNMQLCNATCRVLGNSIVREWICVSS